MPYRVGHSRASNTMIDLSNVGVTQANVRGIQPLVFETSQGSTKSRKTLEGYIAIYLEMTATSRFAVRVILSIVDR